MSAEHGAGRHWTLHLAVVDDRYGRDALPSLDPERVVAHGEMQLDLGAAP